MAIREKVKIAVGQIFIEIDQEEKNLEKVLKFIDLASENGADIIAFPECSNNGYVYRDVEHAFSNATPIPGSFTKELGKKAKEKHIHVVIGLAERAEYSEIYNSAVLIDYNGDIIGKYRKNFLGTPDRLWWKPSKIGFPVFPTEFGNIGIFICADGRIFENARCLSLAGADILFDVTNWFHYVQVKINTPARAIENGVWVVAANKVGYECPIEHSWMTEAIGNSFIIDPKGNVISQASSDKEEIIYGVINPYESRMKKVGKLNNIFEDRRPEIYESLTQSFENLPISSSVKEPIIPEDYCIQSAALQINLEKGSVNTKGNMIEIISRVERASYLLSDLIVLPELFNIGREIKKDKGIRELAETVPGLVTDSFSKISRKYRNYIVGTILENENGKLFNTAFLVGPDGYIGKYRKTHLWEDEISYLTPGDLGFPVFNTSFGNLGIMIGYDGFFPEVARILTLQGADIIAWPALWDMEIYPSILCPARSVDNRIFITAASQVGDGMVGQSMIADPDGMILSRGEKDKEQFVKAKLDLYNSRNKKRFVNGSVIFDRKRDYYEILCSPHS
ncbi:MAG: nitrilase-related carbon-nitrogen hydrolase [Candidatus Hodarchaeota archaeon]